jgi:hypothetical protein
MGLEDPIFKMLSYLEIIQRPRSPVKYSKDEPSEPARFPIDNEIPDSVNVQANQPPDVSVPGSVENSREARQQQLNLGLFRRLLPDQIVLEFKYLSSLLRWNNCSWSLWRIRVFSSNHNHDCNFNTKVKEFIHFHRLTFFAQIHEEN